jgi:hypothetical protein
MASLRSEEGFVEQQVPCVHDDDSYNCRIRTIEEDFSKFREQPIRKGKWTSEEEDYANKIISLFNRGILPIEAGTTLRSHLSEKLHWWVIFSQ